MERLQHYGESLPLETFLTVPQMFEATGGARFDGSAGFDGPRLGAAGD
jgi:hypothetical protein